MSVMRRLTGSVLASTATAGQLLGVAVTLADAYRNAVTDRRLLANVNVSLSLSGPQQLQVQLPLADTGFRCASSLQCCMHVVCAFPSVS